LVKKRSIIPILWDLNDRLIVMPNGLSIGWVDCLIRGKGPENPKVTHKNVKTDKVLRSPYFFNEKYSPQRHGEHGGKKAKLSDRHGKASLFFILRCDPPRSHGGLYEDPMVNRRTMDPGSIQCAR